jgi:hypothetical protein
LIRRILHESLKLSEFVLKFVNSVPVCQRDGELSLGPQRARPDQAGQEESLPYKDVVPRQLLLQLHLVHRAAVAAVAHHCHFADADEKKADPCTDPLPALFPHPAAVLRLDAHSEADRDPEGVAKDKAVH